MTVNGERVDPTVGLGDRLSDEWSDEGCRWSMRYEAGAGIHDPWVVVLEWWTDQSVPHQAEYMRLTWEFVGNSCEDALGQALSWVCLLAHWRRCDACGGEGSWWKQEHPLNGGPVRHRVRCDECDGTGLSGRTRP